MFQGFGRTNLENVREIILKFDALFGIAFFHVLLLHAALSQLPGVAQGGARGHAGSDGKQQAGRRRARAIPGAL